MMNSYHSYWRERNLTFVDCTHGTTSNEACQASTGTGTRARRTHRTCYTRAGIRVVLTHVRTPLNQTSITCVEARLPLQR